MLSQEIKNSGSLIDSIDAIRNWRAVGLLLATLVCMALVTAVGGVLAQLSFFLTGLFVLAAYGLIFYGANAVGMMMMDEARGGESRSVMDAVRDSLATSHRLILVLLLVAALYLAGFLALAIVLFICKIPFLGPILYTFVFPVAVVLAGMALFAVPTVVFPLSAPAIWGGAGVMESISQLLAIARKRLVMVLLLMVAVSLIAMVVGMLIGGILFTGVAATAVVSVPILGGMPGVIPDVDRMGLAGMVMAGAGGGHAVAAMVGGGLLFAVAFTLPGMVYLRGASSVYLRAIDGLDLASEQAAMDVKLAAARAKARDLQAQATVAAQAAAQKYSAPTPASAPASPASAPATPASAPASPASAPATPASAPAAPPSAPATPPSPTVLPTAPTAPTAATLTLRCPQCQAPVAADDTFCADCGHRLR
ncbi:MAG: hypothetical protein JWP29_578 [Rhodoferax sp.]|nr:hypothetical protein [Rhodoferax sp.]